MNIYYNVFGHYIDQLFFDKIWLTKSWIEGAIIEGGKVVIFGWKNVKKTFSLAFFKKILFQNISWYTDIFASCPSNTVLVFLFSATTGKAMQAKVISASVKRFSISEQQLMFWRALDLNRWLNCYVLNWNKCFIGWRDVRNTDTFNYRNNQKQNNATSSHTFHRVTSAG